jgi:hypothetical protein
LLRPSKLAVLIAILFILGLARLWPQYKPTGEFPEHPEAIHLARSLAFHHRYADPFRSAPTGPSAYISPAFPAFLALLVHFFGTGVPANFAFRFSAAVATAAELSLLPLLTKRMGLGLSTGALACFLGLLSPILTFPDWEVSYAALLVVVTTIMFWNFLSDPKPRFLTLALLGFLAGLLLLTSATAFIVLAFWFAYSVWKFRQKSFQQGRWAVVLITAAVLTPWTVRNYIVFHRFIPFRTALGLALEASNNDCALAGAQQTEIAGCFDQHNPNHNMAEAMRATSLGEAEYTSEKLHQTAQWIAGHPRRFTALTGQRIYRFWFPGEANSLREDFSVPTTRRRVRLTIYFATLLSIPGFVMLIRRHREAALILASWLVLFPLIYYIALFEDRYRYPVLWVTFVGAAYALCWAGRAFYSWRKLQSTVRS